MIFSNVEKIDSYLITVNGETSEDSYRFWNEVSLTYCSVDPIETENSLFETSIDRVL